MTVSGPYTMLSDVKTNQASVITVGFFDGVHLGHRSVIDALVTQAAKLEAPSVAVTFDRSPRAVVQGENIPLLTSLAEKSTIIRSLGVSRVVVISFDKTFAGLEAREFVESVLLQRIGFQKIILGYDHRFGKGGLGTVETMISLGHERGFDVDVVGPTALDGKAYSSSYIRALVINDGDVESAAKHLGRYFSIAGTVIEGDRRGRTIGFPTANLRFDSSLAVPKNGVYAVFASIEAGPWHQAVMNIGVRPTVTEGHQLVPEVHLIGVKEQLYGKELKIAFVSRLRDEHRFESLDSLITQIETDRSNCIRTLSAVSLPA